MSDNSPRWPSASGAPGLDFSPQRTPSDGAATPAVNGAAPAAASGSSEWSPTPAGDGAPSEWDARGSTSPVSHESGPSFEATREQILRFGEEVVQPLHAKYPAPTHPAIPEAEAEDRVLGVAGVHRDGAASLQDCQYCSS